MNMSSPETIPCQNNSIKTTKNLAFWTLAWLSTMAFATFGPIFLWSDSSVFSIIFITINLFVGIRMIFSNKRHLQSLDEMQRKIQMDAMAITLGATLVAGLSFSMLDVANVISFKAEISYLVFLMGITYAVSVLIGTRRYS